MTSKIMDSKLIKNNFIEYSNLHWKALEILKKANGKRNYKEIASILNLHEKTVSPILKESERLGLTKKEGTCYKKVPGILKYAPRIKKKQKKIKTIPEVVKKASKKRFVFPSHSKRTTFGSQFHNQTVKMANAYMWLYITENTLRKLIRNVFKDESNWWEKRVNVGIKNKIAEAIKYYPYHAAEREDELEYTHLGQLKEIIISKKNWKPFLPFLKEKNKSGFEATIDKAIPSRNSIAHCNILHKEDLNEVKMRFNDIIKMLED